MNCRNCGAELTNESVFCSKCGARTASDASERPAGKKTKWYIGGGILGVLAVAAAVIILFLGSNPVNAYKNAMQDYKYEDAAGIYNEKIKGNLARESAVANFLKGGLEQVKQDYIGEKIDYNEAKNKLEAVKKTDLLNAEASSAQSEIDRLNDSRTAFKTGEELLDKLEVRDAITKLKNVAETDTRNYAKAQELIKGASSDYKAAVMGDAEKLASEHKYGEAVALVDEALTILVNDPDMTAKKTAYNKKNEEKLAAERKQKIEDARKKQEVAVVKASFVVQDGNLGLKALYPDMIQVLAKNNSNKTVKNITVSMLGFDPNGLPVKIKSHSGSSEASYEHQGAADDVNMIPGATFGKGKGWEIEEDSNIKTVLACIVDAEYYDGTKWENEYYPYWLEEYEEKPLTKQ